MLLEQIVDQVLSATPVQPGDMLAGVEPERQRGSEGEGGILAPVIVQSGVTDLDRAVGHGVEYLKAWHDFACCKRLDQESVVGDLGDPFGEVFAAAIQRVERLRPARGIAPSHFGHRLRNRRRGHRACGEPDAADFKKFTTFHAYSLLYAESSTRD